MGCCESKQQLNRHRSQKVDNRQTPIYQNQIVVSGQTLYAVTTKIQLQETLHSSIVATIGASPNSYNLLKGSGVLLSKNIVLTAAHNLCSWTKKFQGNQYFRVYIQNDGSKYYEVQDWRFPKQFTTASASEDVEYDYAILKIKDNPSQEVSINRFLQVSLPCKCILNKKQEIQLNIYGFPQWYSNFSPLDKKGMTVKLCQYGATKKNAIVQIQNNKIKYSVSTLPGHSGSPVVVDNKIIALHKAGMKTEQYNFGRLVCGKMVDNIQKWCQELGGDKFEVNTNRKCWHARNKIEKSLGHSKVLAVQGLIRKLTNNNQLSFALKRIKQVKRRQEELKKAEDLKKKGDKQMSAQNYGMALQFFLQSLKIRQKLMNEDSIQIADHLHEIGRVYYRQQNYTKAMEYYTLALQIYERVKGKGCFQSATTLNNMGLVYKNQGDYAKAMEYYTLALQIYERVKGKGCFQSAVTLHCMGSVYYNQGNYAKAMEYYTLALQIYERVKGKGCFQSAATLSNMGLVYDNQGNYAKAMEYYKIAQSIWEKHNVKDRGYATTLSNMGLTYRSLKDYGAAAEAFQSSVKVCQANNLQSDAKRRAVELAKCLKVLNRSQKLKQIMGKYGVENNQI